MGVLLLRFLIGGLSVSAFAVVGDLLQPKSFAGLFGAAPSVALAALALAVHDQGAATASTEARSMILGAAAFCLFAAAVCRLTFKRNWPAYRAALAALLVWFGVALGLWLLLG